MALCFTDRVYLSQDYKGDSLLLTTVPGTHLIDPGKIKD